MPQSVNMDLIQSGPLNLTESVQLRLTYNERNHLA